ncbi:MAG TPA: acyl-CoA dehydrogenase family protein, partial [Chloroflexota bacterium]|nr:acyl-CoA dehydrogenase family protein [Chloroflexota bacterium]
MPDYARFDDLLTGDERALRDRVRGFIDAEALPLVADYYERGAFPSHLIPRMAQLGLYRHHDPVADGLISHELERADAGLRSFVSVHVHLAGSAIRFYGSDEQKARYLPAMERGELIGAFSLTEPAHGSDPAGMETTARAVDGGFILNGHKRWSTNGLVADVVVVWAKLDGEVRGFLVEKATKGYRPVEIARKLSFRMSVSSELFFEECFLPAAQLLPGATGLGGPLRCLSEARYGIAWGTAGAAQACFEEALSYSLS